MRRHWKVAFAAAALTAGAILALDRAFPPDLTRYETRSPELVDAEGHTLHIALAADGMWRLSVRPEDVSPRYLSLLLAKEDRRFWHHPGVDPISMARAAWQLATHGHVVSGASTLTMQVARLLMPHRHDLAGKLIEMARAVQLEAHYSKRDILAMYLTLAPFGGNIEGVRAASLAYFGHEPATLGDGEAALLAALPQSPTRFRLNRHPLRALAAEDRVLERAGLSAAAAIVPPTARHPFPALAPHLAERLVGRPGPVVTTIQAPLQSAIEALAARETQWLGPYADLAVLVVRNDDRAVLAYLGGTDFFGSGGMVDMVRARRSPGSALKPFIYGIAFDDALIAPDTVIDDVPLRIGDYAPRNFDRVFHGAVTAREALQQSYNLPAVEILNRIGPGRFAAALEQAGAAIALPSGTSKPGLSIALGGLGISLEDLTKLYVGLADDGVVAPLRLLRSDYVDPGAPLMTGAAARQVGQILRATPRPNGFGPSQPRLLAYKTGTSYGFHDAWAVGFSGLYTVAVWVGRVDGSSRPGAYGLDTAAPILFKVFDLLPEEPAPPSRADPIDVARLAPSLRHFSLQGPATLADETAGPSIVYPPAGATFDITQSSGTAMPMALEANGGRPPYRWIINGVPLPNPPVGTIPSWMPDGPGFARISVMDAEDRASSEEVRLE